MNASDDWAVRINDDGTIDLAPDVTVHRNAPQGFGRRYTIVRRGEVVFTAEVRGGQAGRLLDSVATDDPVPTAARRRLSQGVSEWRMT